MIKPKPIVKKDEMKAFIFFMIMMMIILYVISYVIGSNVKDTLQNFSWNTGISLATAWALELWVLVIFTAVFVTSSVFYWKAMAAIKKKDAAYHDYLISKYRIIVILVCVCVIVMAIYKVALGLM